MKKPNSTIFDRGTRGIPKFFPLSSTQYRFICFISCVILLALIVLPRFIHLDADPPPDYLPKDSGYHIDEGYKTLSPKNLLIFNQTNWHPQDEYQGWMNASPATQWPFFLVFKNFGLKLAYARSVNIIYFILFSIVALFLLSNRYGFLFALLAPLLLATDIGLFHFSRNAIFEIAIIFFIFNGFLLLSRVTFNNYLLALGILVTFALITMFTVKKSAILYCAPAIITFSLLTTFASKQPQKRNMFYLIPLALSLLVVAVLTSNTWLYRIHLDTVPFRFLLNPMPDISPLALLLAYSCILHILLVKPETLYKDLYRLSLVATVIGAPLLLSFFKYNPPRYYVPILPACLLLTVEWAHLKLWKNPTNHFPTIANKIVITIVFIPFAICLLRAIEILIIKNLPFNIGEDPGISPSTLYKLFPIFLFVLAITFYITRNKSIAVLGFAIPLLALTHVMTGIFQQTNTLMHPSYDSKKIRNALELKIKSTESIAGDWAPFFTAESPIRSFYMSKGINFPTPEHINKIRPNYFLSSDSPFDPASLAALQSNKEIKLRSPIMLGTFMDHNIKLYQINYFK
jgi:hypothetical protein